MKSFRNKDHGAENEAVRSLKGDSSSRPAPMSKGTRRFKRCIIHIGTEKTGSTAIQNYLANSRRTLRKRGVLYPRSIGANHNSHWEYVAAAHNYPWKQDIGHAFEISDADSQLIFRKHLLTMLQAEFSRYPNTHTLIISSEHFHSRLNELGMIETLKNMLEPLVEKFKIIVYFRRQDQLALSFQSTKLKSAVDLSIAELNSGVNAPPAYFAYDRLFENWSSVFGTSSMIARLYCSKAWVNCDIVSDFCASCDIPGPRKPSEFVNRSLNRKGFQFLRALNKQHPVMPGNVSNPVRQALVQEISERFAGKYYLISREQAEFFYRQFEETNERLRQMAFPLQPAPLFYEDFSEYPEIAESIEPDYSDAVDIAIDLWRSKWRPESPQKLFLKKMWWRIRSLLVEM